MRTFHLTSKAHNLLSPNSMRMFQQSFFNKWKLSCMLCLKTLFTVLRRQDRSIRRLLSTIFRILTSSLKWQSLEDLRFLDAEFAKLLSEIHMNILSPKNIRKLERNFSFWQKEMTISILLLFWNQSLILLKMS